MKRIETIRELQEVELYISKELVRVCKENNVQIYLSAGTLLGAVREKGFIPWDDDVDFCMSRPEFEKLMQATGGKIGEKCRIIDTTTDQTYPGLIPLCVYENSYVRSMQFKKDENLKISCSIFIYDGAPATKIGRFFYYKHMYLLRAKHALCRADFKHVNTKIARKVGPFLSHFFKEKSVWKYKAKIMKFQQKYPYSESRFVSTNADSDAKNEVFLKETFEKPVEVEFEGMMFPTFSHYREYLESVYGDYMTPPPETARNPKHGFIAEIEDEFYEKIETKA
ncbi:MAG: hypothetical protein E7680_02605 [Ruminococcaceae bacterium]|nr:hypothetical protein [Oscillospiraceae bacterium]